jgi:cytochrome c oxidase subunit III
MPTIITEDVKVRPSKVGGGGGGQDPGGGDPFNPGPTGPKDWPPGFTRDDAIQPQKYRIGMWVAMASILMLFVALTSAYIVRQVPAWNGGERDWVRLEMPPVMWVNTAVILLSSVTIELARRALNRGDYERLNRWLVLTTILGIGFLAGQLVAWGQLAAQGIYVNSHPHSSFFYLMTGVHGLHLLGGIIALGYVTVRALMLRVGVQKRSAVRVTALYWHFMDGLWVYLFLLLFFWK